MAANGLIQRAQEPAAAPAAAAPMEAGAAPAAAPMAEGAEGAEVESEGDESNLTPEEQETYDSAMAMVAEIIYTNEESHQAILDTLRGENPASEVAESTVLLMSQIEETFQGNYPEDLVITTADEISDMLMELGEEAGKFEYTEQLAKETKTVLIELLGDEYGAAPEDAQEALVDVTSEDVANINKEFGVGNG